MFLTDSYTKAAQFCPYISKYIYALGAIVVVVVFFLIEIIEIIKQGEEK